MLHKYTYLMLSIFAIFLVPGLSGCRAAEKKVVRFGYIASGQLHSPAVMIMKERKMLEAAGFKVEWNEYMAGSLAVQGLGSDLLDFAVCGAVPVMAAHSHGLGMAILAGSNREGSSLVVKKEIDSAEKLEGKRIATPGLGSVQDALLSQLAKTHDVRISRTSMEVFDMPLFLQRGDIDGFLAWAPHPAKAVDQDCGHELFTSRDIIPNHQCCVLVTSENILHDDPETVGTVLEVYLEAYQWFLDNVDESIKLLSKNIGVSEAIIGDAMRIVHYAYPPWCNIESIRFLALGLIETGRMRTKEDELDFFIQSLYRQELLTAIFGGEDEMVR